MILTLGDKQRIFVFNISKLITWAYWYDYEFTFGEAYRTPEQAALNQSKGLGISNSLHLKRLAIDLNLFIRKEYKTDTESHRPIGQHWKSLHSLNRWGGDFSKPDGNHYSMEHEGVK